MILESLHYAQHEGTAQEWRLDDCTFGGTNLIVGENASGKSRVLNVVGNLASVLSGDKPLFSSANYAARFRKDTKTIDYALRCERGAILGESLSVNQENLLTREASGAGIIYFEELRRKVNFHAPVNQVVSVVRRDAIQHPFLGDLYDWGKSVRHFHFGSDFGKQNFTLSMKTKEQTTPEGPIPLNPKDPNMVVPMFIQGQTRFAAKFTDPIIRDMGTIGYRLTEIGVAPPVSVAIEGIQGGALVGLFVQEADLKGRTDQLEMSQGMFRALSLFTQIAYAQLLSTPGCILIDDVGEGLDYNRSTSLVRLLIERTKEAGIQLIMATNDRFVMNNVPLEYWSVIQRTGGSVKIHSQRNSPDLFKRFDLTGLNNFDFFSSKYYLGDGQKN